MSRSVHTDPKRVRAARRVRSPRAPRGAGDLAAQRAVARSLKASGIVIPSLSKETAAHAVAPLPRIRVRRPRKGYRHAVKRGDVVSTLQFFGETCTYGIESIELAASPADSSHCLHFGKLLVPGHIILYPQPIDPWRLPGRLPVRNRNRLERAGAIVQMAAEGAHTRVTWPDETLRDFILFDVLLHEIGHHLIQHYGGKRRVRAARTKDHEAFARRFADRCRAISIKHQALDP